MDDGAADQDGKVQGSFARARIASLAALALSSIIGTAIFMRMGTNPFAIFRYYTTLSNVLLAVVCMIEIRILMRGGETGGAFAAVKLATVIAILLTGIVFSLFLAGKIRFVGWMTVGNFFSHYFSPFAAPVAWILFSEKGRVRFRQAGIWLVFPLSYVAYALIQGALTGFYPYWFLNPVQGRPAGIGSYRAVALFVAALSAVFVGLGCLLVLADKLIHKKRRTA